MTTPTLYRSKPTMVEAIQWRGSIADLFGTGLFGLLGVIDYSADRDPQLLLLAGKDGAQGWVPVPLGHWIVRNPGDATDWWPVDPTYFQAKYEAAS